MKAAPYYIDPSIMNNTSERVVQPHSRLAFNEFTLTHFVWNTCNCPLGTAVVNASDLGTRPLDLVHSIMILVNNSYHLS